MDDLDFTWIFGLALELRGIEFAQQLVNLLYCWRESLKLELEDSQLRCESLLSELYPSWRLLFEIPKRISS